MEHSNCAVAGDTKVETPEGSMALRTVAGKAITVFTRDPSRRLRFRMMQNVRKTAEQQPVLKVTLANGETFRVAPQQVVLKKGALACRADALRTGDLLEYGFHFPEGYRYKDDATGELRESNGCIAIAGIEPAGNADLYSLSVHKADCFMLAAGVFCQAEPTPA